MKYEWSFGPAEVFSNEKFIDVVSHVHWYCTGFAPDGTTYKDSGAVKLDTPDPSKFMPFSNLNQSTVRNWVFSKISASAVEANLANQYASKSQSPVKPFNF